MNKTPTRSDPEQADAAIPLWPVLLVNFIGTMGLSIVIPFLVFVVRDWGGNSVVYGFMAATYPAFQLIGAPLLGRWSDRIGRRKVLLLSQAGTLFSWLVFASAFFLPETILAGTGKVIFTLPLLLVFCARAFDGLTGGNVSVANAYVSDISTDENRNRNFGWMGAAASTGFIVGPALSGVLGSTQYGELIPVLTAACISLIAVVVICLILPESNPCAVQVGKAEDSLRRTLGQETKDCFDDESTEKRRWRTILRHPNVPLMLMVYFLIFLAFNTFYTAFPNQAAVNLEWKVTQVGWFFTMLSGLMVLVQGPILSRLSRHFAPPKLMLAGGFLMATCFAVMMLSRTTTTYAATILFAAGNGIMWPSYMAMLSRTGGKNTQGSVQGLATSAGSIAAIIGLISGGVLFSLIGEFTFAVSAIVIIIAALLSMRLLSEFPKPLSENGPG